MVKISLVSSRTLVVYTTILVLFGLFTTLFFEEIPSINDDDIYNIYGLKSTTESFSEGSNNIAGEESPDSSLIVDGVLFVSSPSAFVGNEIKDVVDKEVAKSSTLSILFSIPGIILNLCVIMINLPFNGINYLHPIVSFIVYTPYVIILFFDVVIPLLLKILDIIGDYIPFT